MNSKTRRILFCTGAVLLLVLIAGLMFIVGRGHSVYLDNKTLEYDGQTYNAYHKVEVVQNGKTLTELNKRERGAATNIGQNFKITLIVTKEKKGAEETHEIQLKLPYSLDGIVINIPGYLEGLPQEAWMSEFIPVATQEEQKEEAPTSDEFGLDDIGDF
ncbi:MAG: hypothetical protein IJI82_06930 [Clostridia bacterium]|nr:hypothetical protein [Clostridia bacterium]